MKCPLLCRESLSSISTTCCIHAFRKMCGRRFRELGNWMWIWIFAFFVLLSSFTIHASRKMVRSSLFSFLSFVFSLLLQPSLALILLLSLLSLSCSFSMRILPHKQDTNGFFVCVLRKTKPCPVRPSFFSSSSSSFPSSFSSSSSSFSSGIQEEEDDEKQQTPEAEIDPQILAQIPGLDWKWWGSMKSEWATRESTKWKDNFYSYFCFCQCICFLVSLCVYISLLASFFVSQAVQRSSVLTAQQDKHSHRRGRVPNSSRPRSRRKAMMMKMKMKKAGFPDPQISWTSCSCQVCRGFSIPRSILFPFSLSLSAAHLEL